MLCHVVASSLNPGQEVGGDWLAANLDEVGNGLEEAVTTNFWSQVDEELSTLHELEAAGDQPDVVTQ